MIVPFGLVRASAQNDAGSGGDAPDQRPGLALAPGNYSGELRPEENDTADVYNATATTYGGDLRIVTRNCAVEVDGKRYEGTVDLVVAAGRTLEFALVAPNATNGTNGTDGTYDISYSARPQPSYAALALDTMSIDTPASRLPQPSNVVRFTVRSVGTKDWSGALTLTVGDDPIDHGRQRIQTTVTLGVGISLTCAATFPTVGYLGSASARLDDGVGWADERSTQNAERSFYYGYEGPGIHPAQSTLPTIDCR